MLRGADTTGSVHTVINSIVRGLSHLSVFDWVLVGGVVMLIAWGWLRAMAFARLGTIEIEDLASDDDKLGAKAVKAQLQSTLSKRGVPPHSGVPNGAPSPTSLAAAVAEAPIEQAKWLSALIGLIRFPPSSAGFRVSGALLSDDDPARKCGLSYQLVSIGPRQRVQLGERRGPDWKTVVDAAANDIYRRIVEGAPEIYPTWSRWSCAEALDAYNDGLELERAGPASGPAADTRTATERYMEACGRYRQASEFDPDNMLVRLRAANCLERIAAGIDREKQDERFAGQVKALQAYHSIRLRQPTIFEAGFRASVLFSGLANTDSKSTADGAPDDTSILLKEGPDQRKLLALLGRHGLETAKYKDDYDLADSGPVRRVIGTRRESQPRVDRELERLRRQLEKAGKLESKQARRSLQPWSTIVREGRFRHRFEPRGRERRQLLKALRMARWAQRARRVHAKDKARSGSVLPVQQLLYRMWVSCFHMGLRSSTAGWAANYNAACFYALLPEASAHNTPYGSVKFRRRALRYLKKAVESSDGALACSWVRDEDRDLDDLRELSPHRFASVIAPICPDVATIHYLGPLGSGDWELCAWGEAIRPEVNSEARRPARKTDEDTVFRVTILDENKPVFFRAQNGDTQDVEQWMIPAECPGCEVWLRLGDSEIRGPLSATIIEINYVREPSVEGWALHVWGDATVPCQGRPWDQPLRPSKVNKSEASFRIRIFDGTKPLYFLARNGETKDTPEWSVTPGAHGCSAVWIYAGDPTVYAQAQP